MTTRAMTISAHLTMNTSVPRCQNDVIEENGNGICTRTGDIVMIRHHAASGSHPPPISSILADFAGSSFSNNSSDCKLHCNLRGKLLGFAVCQNEFRQALRWLAFNIWERAHS